MFCLGFNACIFAYGPTGSGKTHTMIGTKNEHRGIIPRAIEHLFSLFLSSPPSSSYKVSLSIVELYLENFTDLLSNSPNSSSNAPSVVKIRTNHLTGQKFLQNAKGENLTHEITTIEQALFFIKRAFKNRSTCSTESNSQSSRSHVIVTLEISHTNSLTAQTFLGKLNLVDLAGNERLKESKAEGQSKEETKKINSSLHALGNVLGALRRGDSNIPYRDNKITEYLQDSLGGNSKTFFHLKHLQFTEPKSYYTKYLTIWRNGKSN